MPRPRLRKIQKIEINGFNSDSSKSDVSYKGNIIQETEMALNRLNYDHLNYKAALMRRFLSDQQNYRNKCEHSVKINSKNSSIAKTFVLVDPLRLKGMLKINTAFTNSISSDSEKNEDSYTVHKLNTNHASILISHDGKNIEKSHSKNELYSNINKIKHSTEKINGKLEPIKKKSNVKISPECGDKTFSLQKMQSNTDRTGKRNLLNIDNFNSHQKSERLCTNRKINLSRTNVKIKNQKNSIDNKRSYFSNIIDNEQCKDNNIIDQDHIFNISNHENRQIRYLNKTKQDGFVKPDMCIKSNFVKDRFKLSYIDNIHKKHFHLKQGNSKIIHNQKWNQPQIEPIDLSIKKKEKFIIHKQKNINTYSFSNGLRKVSILKNPCLYNVNQINSRINKCVKFNNLNVDHKII